MEPSGADSALYVTGLVCLGSHLIGVLLFKRILPDGAWRRHPQFLAHQMVALPLMLVCTYIGCSAWFWPSPEERVAASTVDGRVHGVTASGELLARVVIGAQLFWDIPTTALVPALYSQLMMGHHVGLTIIAVVCSVTPWVHHYVPFFAGVIEVSAVPLVIVDIFHPTRYGDLAEGSAVLGAINMACRVLFALLFLLFRGLYFPYVICFVLRDMVAVMTQGTEIVAPMITVACGVSMTLLQFFWGALIVKQLKKLLCAPPPDSDGSRYAQHQEEVKVLI